MKLTCYVLVENVDTSLLEEKVKISLRGIKISKVFTQHLLNVSLDPTNRCYVEIKIVLPVYFYPA